MSASKSNLVTVEQAADHLAVGRSTVYGLIASGEIRHVKIGRSTRIPFSELEEYVERLLEEEDDDDDVEPTSTSMASPLPAQPPIGTPPVAHS